MTMASGSARKHDGALAGRPLLYNCLSINHEILVCDKRESIASFCNIA